MCEDGAVTDDKKPEKVAGGKTIRQYWEADHNCIVEHCNDVAAGDYKYAAEEWGVKNNATNAKPSEAVVKF